MLKHVSCRLFGAITKIMTFQPAIQKTIDLPACVNVNRSNNWFYKAKLIG